MRAGATLAVCLLLVACGSRLGDEERTLAQDSPPASSGGGAAESTGAEGGTTLPPNGEPTAPNGDAPTGPAPPAPTSAGPAQPATCASSGKASDVGVTPTEIAIGNVSTISGPIQGFGQTGVNAVKAYVNFVNGTGGVCGRKLKLLTGDDRLDAGTNKSEHDKLKDKVFAFVGGTTVVDDGGATTLEGTNIPDVALSIAESRITLPNNFSPSPIDVTSGDNGIGNILAHMKATYGVSNGAIIWPAQAAARTRGQAYVKDLQKAGITITEEHQFEVGVTETNYASQVAKMKNDKVDIVITALELNGMSKLAQAFGQAQYFPKVPFYGAQAYGRKFLQLAGRNAEGTKLGVAYNILEARAEVAPIDTFITWYERTAPGADIDFFAIMSWVSADMFVSALRAAGGDPTRDDVLATLGTYTAYDGGGLIGKINPAAKRPAACFLIVEVRGGRWVKTHPGGSGFAC
jgi:ABC-type branched-subunit amino acid transport system substrate-binding protein